jgi:hypothetical protein
MKRLSFPKAVGEVLLEEGFSRSTTVEPSAPTWVRHLGYYRDTIEIQVSIMLNIITINTRYDDLVTKAIVDGCCLPGDNRARFRQVDVRPGRILRGPDAGDEWWSRSEPDGPAKLADFVRTKALPFLGTVHSLEGMRDFLEPRLFSKQMWDERMDLAVTLCRLGNKARAAEVIEEP